MRPRSLCHRGSIACAALLFEHELLGIPAARRRVLSLWTRGATVQSTPLGPLLGFAAPVRMDARTSSGRAFTRLVSRTDVLSSAPLDPDEIERLDPGTGATITVANGFAVELLTADELDPAAWIDLADWTIVQAAPLDPVAPLALALAPEKPTRSLFSEVAGTLPEEAVAARRALIKLVRPDADTTAGGELARSARALGAVSTWSARLLLSVISFLAPLLSRGRAASPLSPAAQAARPESAPSRWRDWLARVLLRTRLGAFLQRRQAEYMQRLLAMFERGDLEAALKHAIPLARDGEAAASGPPATRVPGPRALLDISHARTPARSSMGFGFDLFEFLRQRYRAAFERLCEQGKIDEAAFVLAELLGADEEAVAFLERHGRYQLAAELAEGRKLPAGLIVRQWYLAGNRKRAMQVARANGAFADAVTRLEKSGCHEDSAGLRLAWADSLALAGDYAAAAEVVWDVASAADRLMNWIDLGIEQGGASGARMIARKLAIAGETHDVTARNSALALFESDPRDPEARRTRIAFCRALVEISKPSRATRAIARAATRALYADSPWADEAAQQKLAEQLHSFCGDTALRADRPAWPAARPATAKFELAIAAHDRGTISVRAAALLPSGRTLVALGEAGVRLVDRTGKTLAHFDEPADQLVLSDRGDRAIAIASRGRRHHRLARIDVIRRKSEPWTELDLCGFAPTFDGSTWVAAVSTRERRFGYEALLLDVTLDGVEVLKKLGESTGYVGVARTPTSCSIAVSEGDRFATHRYDVPSWTLRGVKPGPEMEGAIWGWAGGGALTGMLTRAPWTLAHVNQREVQRDLEVHPDELPTYLYCTADVVAVALSRVESCRALVLGADLVQRGELRLDGACSASLRLDEASLVVADDLGRVLAVDVGNGTILRDLRMR